MRAGLKTKLTEKHALQGAESVEVFQRGVRQHRHSGGCYPHAVEAAKAEVAVLAGHSLCREGGGGGGGKRKTQKGIKKKKKAKFFFFLS